MKEKNALLVIFSIAGVIAFTAFIGASILIRGVRSENPQTGALKHDRLAAIQAKIAKIQMKFGHKKEKRKRGQRPNIILIMADDLGWADVSWNNAKVKMPHMTRLVKKEGRILTNMYAHSTCSPSRAALMTGIYSWRMGLDSSPFRADQVNGIPLGVPFLPKILKRKNYKNHFVGKWHAGFCNDRLTPTQRGFDSFYGFYTGVIHYTSHDHVAKSVSHSDNGPISQIISGYDYRRVTKDHNGLNVDEILFNKTGIHSTVDFTNQAVDLINKFDSRDRLFLTVSYNAPHFPWIPSSSLDAYNDTETLSPHRRNYLNMLTELDTGVGLIKKALESKKMWKNSIIFFVSDNGAPHGDDGGSNWPLRGGKGSLFDGGSKVPAFIASPLINNQGKPYNDLIHFVDLPVIVQSLAGVEKDDEDHQDGIDLWDSLNDLDGEKRESLVYHIDKARRSKHEIESNPDLKAVLEISDVNDSAPVLSSAVRFLNYKFIKQVHNLKELVYPHRVVNEFDIAKPPSEVSIDQLDPSLSRPYDKPLRTGTHDYWLFDTEADPAERFNLLFDPEFFPLQRQMLIDEFDRILRSESDAMIVPQSNYDRKITSVDSMIQTSGNREFWATDWCDENDMLEANLFKQFY